MAIGRVRLGDTAQVYSRTQANPEAFGAGIGRAIGRLAEGVEDFELSKESIALAEMARREKKEGFEASVGWENWKWNTELGQSQRRATAAANGQPIVEQTQEELETEYAQFRESLPGHLQLTYDEKFERMLGDEALSAFQYEYETDNANARAGLQELTNTYASRIQTGKADAGALVRDIEEHLENTQLTEVEKRQILTESSAFLHAVEFRYAAQVATESGQEYRATTPGRQRFMGVLANQEGTNKWNVIYGGQTFEGFADHPRKGVLITSGPNKGSTSDAAGMFQFLSSTWDWVATQIPGGLPDFSPENQTRAALWYMEHRYNQVKPLGLTFDEVIDSNDPAMLLSVKHTLSGDTPGTGVAWEGLQNRFMNDAQFLEMFGASEGVSFEGLAPDIFSDPKFADIPYADKLELIREASSNAAAGQKSRRDSTMDDIRTRINAGEDIGDALGNAQRRGDINAMDVQNLQARYEVVQKEAFTLQSALNNLADPTKTWGNSAEDKKELNSMFDQKGAAAFKSMDEEYVNEVFAPFVGHTGVIPTNASAMLSRMVQGSDEQASMFALKTMSMLENLAPDSFTMQLSDHAQAVDYYQFSGEYMTPPELVERLQFMQNPQYAAARKTLDADAGKLLPSFTPAHVMGKFDKEYLSDPKGLHPTSSMILMQDWNRLFRDNYVFAQGDMTVAESMTTKQLARVWGTTTVGGASQRMGKYLPERYPSHFPTTPNGSLDWMDVQVRAETGLAEGQEFQLISDDQTKLEADQGKVPSYLIAYMNDEGFPVLAQGTDIPIVGPDGQITTRPNALPYRYTGEYTQELGDFYQVEGRERAVDLLERGHFYDTERAKPHLTPQTITLPPSTE